MWVTSSPMSRWSNCRSWDTLQLYPANGALHLFTSLPLYIVSRESASVVVAFWIERSRLRNSGTGHGSFCYGCIYVGLSWLYAKWVHECKCRRIAIYLYVSICICICLLCIYIYMYMLHRCKCIRTCWYVYAHMLARSYVCICLHCMSISMSDCMLARMHAYPYLSVRSLFVCLRPYQSACDVCFCLYACVPMHLCKHERLHVWMDQHAGVQNPSEDPELNCWAIVSLPKSRRECHGVLMLVVSRSADSAEASGFPQNKFMRHQEDMLLVADMLQWIINDDSRTSWVNYSWTCCWETWSWTIVDIHPTQERRQNHDCYTRHSWMLNACYMNSF